MLAWETEYRRKGIVWRGFPSSGFEVPSGSRVLELGCGNGKVLSSLKGKGLRTYGIDFSNMAIELSKRSAEGEKAELLKADMRLLPFRECTFDAVIANHVLEHLSMTGRGEAVAEMRRVLKPGGRAYVRVLSTRDMRYGKGRQIEMDTFVRGNAIASHYFTLEEVLNEFSGFEELEIREEVFEKLYSGEPVRRAAIRAEFIRSYGIDQRRTVGLDDDRTDW